MDCQLCKNKIDQEATYLASARLIKAIDKGRLKNPTDIQQSVYLGKYCADCIERLDIAL